MKIRKNLKTLSLTLLASFTIGSMGLEAADIIGTVVPQGKTTATLRSGGFTWTVYQDDNGNTVWVRMGEDKITPMKIEQANQYWKEQTGVDNVLSTGTSSTQPTGSNSVPVETQQESVVPAQNTSNWQFTQMSQDIELKLNAVKAVDYSSEKKKKRENLKDAKEEMKDARDAFMKSHDKYETLRGSSDPKTLSEIEDLKADMIRQNDKFLEQYEKFYNKLD